VAADDLGTPLGSGRTKRAGKRLSVPMLPFVTGLLASIIALALIWLVFVDNPLGGEPKAVVTIEPPKANEEARPPALAAAPPVNNPRSAENISPGAQTVTIIDGKSGARKEVTVRGKDSADESVGTAPPLDVRLAESARHGVIPRMAPDGARPLDVYARTSATTASDRKGPRIAIVVGGLGVGAGATNDAITKLPDVVTLAFAPYGADLSRWVARARGAGHEIMLQLPMEPFDYPDNDPGPQTLLSSLPTEQNLDRLYWFLSRFQGYVGVTNFMGARFSANETALSPVLGDLAKRGLLYLDDGSSPRSLAQKVAVNVKIPFLKADLVVDSTPNWSEIDAALERLEKLAAERGFAVGTASALPVTLERIARWAKAAEARGVRIVPLSALVLKAKQS
jgi:hypothetical protein